MEAMAGKGSRSAGGSAPPHGNGDAKAVPGYLRPSAGSCHHVCKYGGQHTFGEKDQARKAQPKPRRQPSPAPDGQKIRTLVKSRSVSRRRVVDFSKLEKAGTSVVVVGEEEEQADAVEWKDIVAYDTIPAYDQEPSPFAEPENIPAQVANLRDCKKKKDAMKGKKSHGKQAMITEEEGGVKKKNESMNKKLIKSVRSKLTGKASREPQAASRATSPSLKNTSSTGGKSVKPPAKAKKIAAASPAEKKAVDQEMVQGDDEAADVKLKEGEALHPLDQEYAAAESSRPIPVHRRVRSMSMSISSRSVRFPFVRQASKNSGAVAFKVRSKSSKAPITILPSEEEKPARLRFRKGRPAGEESSSGIQLRTRSLRRRGVGGAGGANCGFVVPAVALRHQKTLEKKRSQRLYNNLIEETASRLAKTRKSRVKALVGAFETLISKIGK